MADRPAGKDVECDLDMALLRRRGCGRAVGDPAARKSGAGAGKVPLLSNGLAVTGASRPTPSRTWLAGAADRFLGCVWPASAANRLADAIDSRKERMHCLASDLVSSSAIRFAGNGWGQCWSAQARHHALVPRTGRDGRSSLPESGAVGAGSPVGPPGSPSSGAGRVVDGEADSAL